MPTLQAAASASDDVRMSLQERDVVDRDGSVSPLALILEGLRRLDGEQMATLERGLSAMADGDFTHRVEEASTPIVLDAEQAEVRAIVDLVNVLGQRLDAAALAYERLRGELVAALGDRSCLSDLLVALHSLHDHCLTDLDTGLQAMADGDLTHAAAPVTHPLRAHPGDALGEVGEVFNEMLARSRTALRSYDAVREDLRASLGDDSCLDDLRGGLRSLQRHCLRDLQEALEAMAEGTALTRRIAPATSPIPTVDGAYEGELALLFNRALARAQAAVTHLADAREQGGLGTP